MDPKKHIVRADLLADKTEWHVVYYTAYWWWGWKPLDYCRL